MNRPSLDSFVDKLAGVMQKIKAFFSRDYSLHDLQKLTSWLANLRPKQNDHQGGLKGLASNNSLTVSFRQRDIHQLSLTIKTFVLHQRNVLVFIAGVMIVFIFNFLVIMPFVQLTQERLEMRPAQWSQLQSLIKLSKSSSVAAPTTVAPLDELEFQKMRGILTARGLKLGVFRLTNDNPPRVELQTSDVMFSVLLDALEELRVSWHLYPEQLKVTAASATGVVNVSGTLVTYLGSSISRAPINGVSQ